MLLPQFGFLWSELFPLQSQEPWLHILGPPYSLSATVQSSLSHIKHEIVVNDRVRFMIVQFQHFSMSSLVMFKQIFMLNQPCLFHTCRIGEILLSQLNKVISERVSSCFRSALSQWCYRRTFPGPKWSHMSFHWCRLRH